MNRTSIRRSLTAAAAAGGVLLATVGIAGAQSQSGITTYSQAVKSIDDGQAQVDAGQAKIALGRDWLAAHPPAAPTTSPGTTTPLPAPSSDGQTAASRLGWGTPLPAGSDEFNGTSLDLSKWGQPGECWPANETVRGGRCASRNVLANGYLRETQTADGKTGYVSSRLNQKYGRWEARIRVTTTTPGKPAHPVLLLWNDDLPYPSGGEVDWFEVNSDATKAEAFLHHPTKSGTVQDHYVGPSIDLPQWNNLAVEWVPGRVTGYLNGQQWWTNTAPNAQPPAALHATAQLDSFNANPGSVVHMDVDWYRAYAIR